jgi:hypothetical protein
MNPVVFLVDVDNMIVGSVQPMELAPLPRR